MRGFPLRPRPHTGGLRIASREKGASLSLYGALDITLENYLQNELSFRKQFQMCKLYRRFGVKLCGKKG